MDLKIVGCGCLSLASFSFLVFDYLTFDPTQANLSVVPLQAASDLAARDPASRIEKAKPLRQKQPEPKITPLEKQVLTKNNLTTIDADRKEPTRLKPFAHSRVTGFLSPNGFSRPNWKPSNNAIWISESPFETQRFVVMLDPGHGGTDPGSIGHNGLLEKHLTLDIAQRTRMYLSKYPNIDIIFTRDTDKGLSRDERVKKIRQSGSDLLISLHFNDLPQTDVALVETYFAGPHNISESLSKRNEKDPAFNPPFNGSPLLSGDHFSFTDSSRLLANILQEHIFSEVQSNNPIAENAGVKRDTLFVLTRSYKPSALIELTCLSNPAEAVKLESDEYLNKLSRALAQGILTYRQTTINAHLIPSTETKHPSNFVHLVPATNDTEQRKEESV